MSWGWELVIEIGMERMMQRGCKRIAKRLKFITYDRNSESAEIKLVLQYERHNEFILVIVSQKFNVEVGY